MLGFLIVFYSNAKSIYEVATATTLHIKDELPGCLQVFRGGFHDCRAEGLGCATKPGQCINTLYNTKLVSNSFTVAYDIDG